MASGVPRSGVVLGYCVLCNPNIGTANRAIRVSDWNKTRIDISVWTEAIGIEAKSSFF